MAELPSDLGELIVCDAFALKQLGWHSLVNHRRPTSNLSSLDKTYLTQLAACYAHMHTKVHRSSSQRNHGPNNNSSAPPSKACIAPHFNILTFFTKSLLTCSTKANGQSSQQRMYSTFQASDFLHQELCPNVADGQDGLVITAGGGLRINKDTIPLAAMESMQFGMPWTKSFKNFFLPTPSMDQST
jgi:hypothetical protein